MLHYFARLGKTKWINQVMPIVGISTTLGYVGFHFFGHTLTRNLLAAQSESGKRKEISKELQNLIVTVYEDIESTFNQPIVDQSVFATQPPTIKWFSSSSLDPITLGMTEVKTGVLIGVPNHYNYDKIEDLPSNFYEIRKIKLFRSMGAKKEQDSQQWKPDSDDTHVETYEPSLVAKIDKETPSGRDYINSMILSEKAKKFSIARELFMGDSYRPLAIASTMVLSFYLSIFLSRGAVLKMNLRDAHLSNRIPIYMISGFAGLMNYYILGDLTNRYYANKADSRAMSVNEPYREGAIEYFTKVIQRNKALRDIVGDMKMTYDKDGNLIENFLRGKYTPLTERLEAAEKFRINATNKAP